MQVERVAEIPEFRDRVGCKQRAFELDPRGRDVVGAHLGFSEQQKQYEPISLRLFCAIIVERFCFSGEDAMSWFDDREDNTIYKVVINHEEQYSIWPADRENPLG